MAGQKSFFGEAIMARCTPSGIKDLPALPWALPKKQMYKPKKAVVHAFPKYTVDAFEFEWKSKCWTTIEQDGGPQETQHGIEVTVKNVCNICNNYALSSVFEVWWFVELARFVLRYLGSLHFSVKNYHKTHYKSFSAVNDNSVELVRINFWRHYV